MKRSPLSKRRQRGHRKHSDRLAHHMQMRDGTARKPNAIEQRHHDRLRALGCLICKGLATIHHVTARKEGGRLPRSHARVVPLCLGHHLHDYGPDSVERLSHGGFFRRFGIDLLAEAKRQWAISEGIERDRQASG